MGNEHKTNVLILIDWYLPGYKAGGPIQSVSNLVEGLRDQVNFSIVTRNSDFGDSSSYENIVSDEWIAIENAVRIHYLSEENQNLQGLKNAIDPDQYDYIYLNSVFSYKFTILPLIAFRSSAAKIILAPRGMLGKGALELKSLKKKIFLQAAKFPGLYNNLIWQATNEQERLEILSVFGKNSEVKIVSNIPSLVPDNITITDKEPRNLKLVFISRISEKKNPLGLINSLSALKVSGNITLDLYGPVEDMEYWSKCQKSIETLPDNILVEYKGPLPQNKIRKVLMNYHIFILMTRHENFGHAIFEAIAAGRPLIISDMTPWRKLEELRIGWDLSIDDEQEFAKAINQCLEMGQEEYTAYSQRAHQYARDYIANDPAIEHSLDLFKC